MEIQEFDGILTDAGGGGVFVPIPFNTEKVYGQKGLVKIKATIDTEAYRGSLAPMLRPGKHCLIVLKAIREKIGKGPGDKVHITLELDTEPREVEIPAELQKLFDKNKAAKEIFNNFSFSHRHEYALWVGEAKKAETREARAQKAIEMISENKKLS